MKFLQSIGPIKGKQKTTGRKKAILCMLSAMNKMFNLHPLCLLFISCSTLGSSYFFQVVGVKGVCQFAQLSSFDVVDGVAVDYMHGILLGICKQLLKLWIDSAFSDEDWYCGAMISLIDERLLSIKPPNCITRVPRSLEQHRKYWKGTVHVSVWYYTQ